MANYDLGTAHGRIVVDYDGRGIQSAEKSLDGLEQKSRSLLGRLGDLAKGWRTQSQGMGADTDSLYNKFVRTGQGAAVLGTSISVLTGHFIDAGKGIKTLGDLQTALGHLPDGAERFPTLVRRIIQVSAAVSLFHGGTQLLARALPRLGTAAGVLALLTRHVPGLNLLSGAFALLTRYTPGIGLLAGAIGRFGGIVNTLTGPLRAVASTALGVLAVIQGFKVVAQYSKFMNLFYVATSGAAAGLYYLLIASSAVAKSIVDLTGAVAILPAAIGAVGFAFLTLKVGLTGVGAAMKAVAKGDAAALQKALKDMAPAAREFVLEYQKISKGFKDIRIDVQQRLFEGLSGVLHNLAGLYLPLVQARMNAVAESFNRAIKDTAAFFDEFEGSVEVANDFGEGLDFTAKGIDNLTKTFAPLIEAFYLIWRVGTEVFADITSGAEGAAKKFRDFVAEARSSGELEAWMRRGVQAVKDFGASLSNLHKIWKTVIDGIGARSNQSFLAWLRDATARLNEFLNSVKGQQMLKEFGDWLRRGAEEARKLAKLFVEDVWPAIQPFFRFMSQISGIDGFIEAIKLLCIVFKGLFEILNILAPVMSPIITAITFMTTVALGLGLAAKIASGAIAIFKLGVLGLKAIDGIAAVIGRLTGSLRLAGAAAKLIKGGIIAAGLMLIAEGIDKMNVAAAGGDPEKLNDMDQTLHDLVTIWGEFWKAIESGDWSWWSAQIDDIKSEWQQLKDGFKPESEGGSPAGSFFDSIIKNNDKFWETTKKTLDDAGKAWDDFWGGLGKNNDQFWSTTQKTFGDIGKWWDDLWSGLGKSWDDFWSGLGKNSDQFWATTKQTFTDLPGQIGDALSGLGGIIGTAAGDMWDGFLNFVKIQFQPVKDWFSKTPYEMGFAIGSGIGEFIKWAGTLWDNFKTASMTKFAEYQMWLSGLLPSLGATFAGWGTQFGIWAGQVWDGFKTGTLTKWAEYQNWMSTLLPSLGAVFAGWSTQFWLWATQVWDGFKNGTLTKWAEYQNWLAGILPSIGAALAGLGAYLAQIASDAWEQFKAWGQRKLDETEANVRSWPAKAGAALASLAGILMQKANEAFDSLYRGCQAGTENVLGFIRSIPGRIVSAIGNLGSLLVGAGRALMDGLLAGIRAAVQAVYDFVSGIAAGIAARKGPLPHDRNLLVPAGNAIIQGLVRGMQQSMPGLWRVISGVNSDIAGIGGRVNLTAAGARPNTMSGLTAMPTLPATYRGGSDGAASGDNYTIGQVTIPAKDIKEFRDVTDFFDAVQQKARAGRATR